MNRITCRLLPALMVLMVAACTRTAPPAPYPHESILSIIAELKLGLDRDPYREPPWQDLQGLNIFKVTLDRLDALEGLAAGEYRDVLDFARGQALERLGQWSEAAAAFDGGGATELAEPATVRAAAARLLPSCDRSRLDVVDNRELSERAGGYRAASAGLGVWVPTRGIPIICDAGGGACARGTRRATAGPPPRVE